MSLNDGNKKLSLRRAESPENQGSEFSDFTKETRRSRAASVQPSQEQYDDGFDGEDEAYQYGFSKSVVKKNSNKEGFSKKKHIKYRIIFGTVAGLLGVVIGVICFGFWYK